VRSKATRERCGTRCCHSYPPCSVTHVMDRDALREIVQERASADMICQQRHELGEGFILLANVMEEVGTISRRRSEVSDDVISTCIGSVAWSTRESSWRIRRSLSYEQRPVRDDSHRKWNTCRLWTWLIYRISLGVIARMKGTRSTARLQRDLVASTRYPGKF
jgi:hypothetical protein